MACKTLARLCHGPPLDDDYMQVTPPVVYSVVPLCKIGLDDTGNKLLSLLEDCGVCRNVETKFIKNARQRDPDARTALSVLPIYQDGRRGCFFDAASNSTFSADEMIEMLKELTSGASPPLLPHANLDEYRDRLVEDTPVYGAFLFGYPHLIPNIQGDALARVVVEAKRNMIEGGIVALDLNGVPGDTFQQSRDGSLRTVHDLKHDAVIGPALAHVDLLHMNQDELALLTGLQESDLEDEHAIANAVNLFLRCGVGVVAVTRGKKGSFVSCNGQERFQKTPML